RGGGAGGPVLPRPAAPGPAPHPPLAYYAVVGVLFLFSFWVMQRVVESPLGKILQAIRENELRAEALGYNVPRMKLAAFVVGGAFSGLAGGPRGQRPSPPPPDCLRLVLALALVFSPPPP